MSIATQSATVVDFEMDTVLDNAENSIDSHRAGIDALEHGLFNDVTPAEDAHYRHQLAVAAESIPALALLHRA